MKRSSIVAMVTVFGVLAAAGGGLALYKYIKFRSAPQGGFEPAEAVEVAQVTQDTWTPSAGLSGTILALQSVTLANETAGRIEEVLFESGAVVEAGQVLVRFETSVERANLASAEAAVRVAEAELRVNDARIELARVTVARLAPAVQVLAAAQADLDAANADLAQHLASRDRLLAAIDQAKAAVAQAQTRLDKKTIVAPFRARAGLRNVHPGQYLAEGTTMVGLQGLADEIFLDFAVPQELSPRARPGMIVRASGPLFPGGKVDIKVVAVDATANPSTRNVRIRGLVPNPDGELRPGMFVDIVVPVTDPSTVTLVPASAVRRASYGDHVFIVGPSANPADKPGTLRAQQRFIKLGIAPNPDRWIVTEGLKPGEQVATVGSFKLRDGALVTIGPPPAQAAGGAGGQAQGSASAAN
jgi:membrane fusion protein (multidrug efflux system)